MRLALQPYWARFMVVAAFWAIFWGIGNALAWRTPGQSVWVTVVVSLVTGFGFAALVGYRGQTWHESLVDAIEGLDKADRSQAIAAITSGVVPADPAVRDSAIHLGKAILGGKPADQLKRQQRRTLIFVGFLVAGSIIWAALQPRLSVSLYFLALGLLAMISALLGVVNIRRVQRSIALLSSTTPR